MKTIAQRGKTLKAPLAVLAVAMIVCGCPLGSSNVGVHVINHTGDEVITGIYLGFGDEENPEPETENLLDDDVEPGEEVNVSGIVRYSRLGEKALIIYEIGKVGSQDTEIKGAVVWFYRPVEQFSIKFREKNNGGYKVRLGSALF